MEELNKYLSGLSEHHDMYVLDMSSPTTWYTKALALVVADKLAGRKSDPVEIPYLLFGWEGRRYSYLGFTGLFVLGSCNILPLLLLRYVLYS